MKITNRGTYYSDKQLTKIIDKMKLNCLPEKLVICETRSDVFRFAKSVDLVHSISIILDIGIWISKIEGIYYQSLDTVAIYVFSQTDDKEDFQSKQLYSLHSLAHEMRHVWQAKNKIQLDEEKEEQDADDFATEFLNQNSEKISKVMNWEEEWEVEEE